LSLHYEISKDTIFDVDPAASAILLREEMEGGQFTSAIGYTYSFDSRRTGLDPNSGVVLRFGQQYAGLGGDVEYIRSDLLVGAETKIWQDEVTVRAIFEGGALHMISGNSRATDRYQLTARRMRGFSSFGAGPRDLDTAMDGGLEESLGGNLYAVARFEADFPVGLPEEYGVRGGLFFDVGSVWSLDDIAGTDGPVDDSFHLRSVIGFSVFWETPIGPLRFNFSHALNKQPYDDEQTFDLTISTEF